MKKCPTCNRTYDDDTQNFCLDDGELLSSTRDSEQETVQLPRKSSAAPRDALEFVEHAIRDRHWTIVEKPNSLNFILSVPLEDQNGTILLKIQNQGAIRSHGLPIGLQSKNPDLKVRKAFEVAIGQFLTEKRNPELKEAGKAFRWLKRDLGGEFVMVCQADFDIKGSTTDEFEGLITSIITEERLQTATFKAAADILGKRGR